MTDAATPKPGELASMAATMAEVKTGKLDTIKSVAWKYLGGAIADAKNGEQVISLGRVAFLVWYGQATYLWQTMPADRDLPASMLTIGISLLAYVTGTKVLDAVRGR